MLTHRRMIKCIQPQDWFAAIDLKDAYFHVSILPRHRPFLRFAFKGQAWQYRVLPFGLSLSPCVFMKVVEGALTPLREVGIRILNYLDDWLVLAQSREQLCDHRDLVFQVDWEKSKLSPVQRISFLGVELDSVSMTACLTDERAQAVLNCLSSFRGRNVVLLKQFQRLLGHMPSTAAVTPLELLHMRPLQHWLHSRVPRWARRCGTLRVSIIQQCCRSLSPLTDLVFLRATVPLEQVSRHTLDGAPTALAHQLPRAVGSASSLMAVPATAVGQARASPHGQHCSCLVHQPVGRYTITPHHSSPTISSSGVTCSSSPCTLSTSRGSSIVRPTISHESPGEWRLHPETIRLIWSRFREAQVDLFASHKSSHCQLYFFLTKGPLGTDTLAHSWPQALHKYVFPPVSLLAQTLCKLRKDEEQVLLVAPHWPTRTWFPKLISLTTALPRCIPPLSGAWHHMAPASRSVEPPCVAPGRDVADLSGLPPAVVETITQARAPSTRQTYALKWSLFANWCSSRQEDPRRCMIGVVLSFLQESLKRRLSPSTLKVYVAAITAHHDAVDGRSL